MYRPFDGTKATSINCLDETVASLKMLAVPAPTTAIFTHGDPAALWIIGKGEYKTLKLTNRMDK